MSKEESVKMEIGEKILMWVSIIAMLMMFGMLTYLEFIAK